MRKVKLITDVVVEEVMCDYGHTLQYAFSEPHKMSYSRTTGECLTTQAKVEVIPVKHWRCFDGWDIQEDYIAINPRINNTIGKYVDILNSEIRQAKASIELEKGYTRSVEKAYTELIENSNLWGRLKYLFTGVLK